MSITSPEVKRQMQRCLLQYQPLLKHLLRVSLRLVRVNLQLG